jgi:ABC-type bacteriocin/lantibiotic exporter with double-glycine peptidase domain
MSCIIYRELEYAMIYTPHVFRNELSELLEELASKLGVSTHRAVRVRAVQHARGDNAEQRFADAAAALGLAARTLVGPLEEVVTLARPDAPVVWRASTLGQPSWWVADGWQRGRVRVRSMDDPRAARWMTPANLYELVSIPETVHALLVEKMWPAAALSATGEHVEPAERLRKLLYLERADVGIVVVFAVAIGILSLATPITIQVLINWVAFGALRQPILGLGFVLLVCLGLAAGLRVVQRITIEVLQRRLFVRAVSDISSRLARVKLEAFDGVHGPELLNRFFDVLTLQKATRALLLDGLSAALQAGVGLAVLAFYHPVLLLFDLVVIGAMALVLVPLGRGAQKTAIDESKAKYAVAGWMEEIARHPIAFKQGGATLGETRADALTQRWLAKREAHFRVFMRQYLGGQLVQVGLAVGLLVLCGALVLDGALTLGQLVAAEFIVASALAGFAKFTDKLETVYDLLAGVDKLGTVVDLPVERADGLPISEGAAPELWLDGVRCAGLTPTGEQGLDLMFPSGTVTSLWVPPDAGRARLAEICAGLRRPMVGRVLRDGLDMGYARPEVVHANTHLLRADGVIRGSLLDNVTLGREDIDEAEALMTMEQLGLGRYLRELSEGAFTLVESGSSSLSRGQSAMLLVARAVVAGPGLVVVDGILDGLPQSVRRAAIQALATSERTVVLLSEDPSLCADSTRHLKLDLGGGDDRLAHALS